MSKVMMDKLNGCIFWLNMMTRKIGKYNRNNIPIIIGKYNINGDKVSAGMKEDFDSESVYKK